MPDFPFRRKPSNSDDRNYTRKTKERKTEAKRAKDSHIDSSDLQGIRNKIGYNKTAKEWKVKKELIRLSKKKPKTWKLLGLTIEDFKKFGIHIGR